MRQSCKNWAGVWQGCGLNNLTQTALAEQAGVSKRKIERLESGEVATQLTGFLRVCRTLGLLERFETLLPEPAPGPNGAIETGGPKASAGDQQKGRNGEIREMDMG